MRENTMQLTLRPFTSNILCEWQEDGVVHHKEITPDSLLSSIGFEEKAPAVDTGLLPPGCLHVRRTGKEQMEVVLLTGRMYADITYYDTVYARFPLPRLVWKFVYTPGCRVRSVYVGVPPEGMLRPDSPMYRYPFSNVASDSRMCLGSNVMPVCETPYTLGSLPYFILSTPNNDDHFTASSNRHNWSQRTLYEQMKDKKPEDYAAILVESGKTLQDFIGSR